MVNIMCEMLLTIMTPVALVRDIPDPKNNKSPGSGQKTFPGPLAPFATTQSIAPSFQTNFSGNMYFFLG